MKVVARVIFSMLFVAIAAMLQGCGCDEEALKLCCEVGCTCSGWTKCGNDAGCCDYEKDGKKMKDAVASVCAATPTETNACA